MDSQPTFFETKTHDGLVTVTEPEASIARGSANADTEWRKAAERAVAAVCRRLTTFTTDDVWFELGDEQSTHDNRAMGGVVKWAQREGLCRPTDRMIRSVRAECHRRRITVWESLR